MSEEEGDITVVCRFTAVVTRRERREELRVRCERREESRAMRREKRDRSLFIHLLIHSSGINNIYTINERFCVFCGCMNEGQYWVMR